MRSSDKYAAKSGLLLHFPRREEFAARMGNPVAKIYASKGAGVEINLGRSLWNRPGTGGVI